MFYILDHEHIPVKATNEEWGAWVSREKKIVRFNEVDGIRVSTVFLGLDHNYTGKGDPVLFETMIFGGEHDQFQERYRTWNSAVEGHNQALEMVK